jgi:RNA polymerase sigma-70 factor, ECF subfamily
LSCREASDAELIADVALVRPMAFVELYDRHSVAAYSLARRIVGVGDADDAVQEAFLTLWRSAATYDASRGAVRSWLLGMVRNRSIDTLRKLEVHARRRSGATNLDEWIEAPGTTTEDHAEQAERASAVSEVLASLPTAQRTVVELAYFSGLTQQQIAARLSIPLGTVKSRTRLAFDTLRGELAVCAPG